MPRKRRPWFRIYTEILGDRKLRRQDPAVRWLWIVVLAIARESPTPGTLLLASNDGVEEPIDATDLADKGALPVDVVKAGMAEFERLGMVTIVDGAWVVTQWGARQFESDDVTRRTRKHRYETGSGTYETGSGTYEAVSNPGVEGASDYSPLEHRRNVPTQEGGQGVTNGTNRVDTASHPEGRNVPTSTVGTSLERPSRAGTRARQRQRTDTDKPFLSEASEVGSDEKTTGYACDVTACRCDDPTVRDLTRFLARGIRDNGYKPPPAGSKANHDWRAAIDKLVRIDGYPPDEIRAVAAWALDHPFWQANIRSAPKFRHQFNQLRLRRRAETTADKPRRDDYGGTPG